MNNEVAAPKGEKAAPPQIKQKEIRQFKSKAPKAGQKSFDDMLGLDGPEDVAIICPWEEFGDVELSDVAQYGMA